MMDDENVVIPVLSDDDSDTDIYISVRSDVNSNTNTSDRSKPPLRKRARYSANDDNAMDSDSANASSSAQEAGSGPVRDDTYYLADGSCVLLVESTLFNVHRTILCKDSSSFRSMFDLPQGDTSPEGMSDENPIVLVGDKVSEFRHFLWSLYALPHELMVVHTQLASLPALISIARVANKYSFKSIETWSLDAIEEYVNRKPSPILPPIPSIDNATFGVGVVAVANLSTAASNRVHAETNAQLTSLVRLAQLCGHKRLLGTVVGLLRQLMGISLQYAYLAMTLADELELGSLCGAAYLEVMQKAVVVRNSAKSDSELGTLDEKGRLIVSPSQQLRLLSGFHKLCTTWESIRASPPAFEHCAACNATWHQHGCMQSWLDFWKEKCRSDIVMNLGLADVTGRLRAIAKEFDRWGSANYMHHDCRTAARRSMQARVKAVEDGLAGFFTDEE